MNWSHIGLLGLLAFFGIGFGRRLVQEYREHPRRLKTVGLNVMLWVGATLSLSGMFATCRRFSGEEVNPYPAGNVLLGLVYLTVLVICFLALGFFMYREDSRSGKIKRRIRFYDNLLSSPISS